MIVYNYNLDVVPGGVPLVIPLTQYSDAFTIVFTLYSSDGNMTIETGSTGSISGTKSDGNGYEASAVVDPTNNTVTVAGDNQITALQGNQTFRISVKKNNLELYSATFIFAVQRAALAIIEPFYFWIQAYNLHHSHHQNL